MKIKFVLVEAGVGEEHPKKQCSWCGREEKLDENGYTDLIATCTHTHYVT